MASIGSQELNDFLYDWVQSDLPNQPIWIGGKSVQAWGDWSWADGAAWSYTNWAGSQPKRDDMGMGDENCVTINGYTGAGQCYFWSLISYYAVKIFL